jgi:cytoskeleton-associated protein 5
MTNANFNRTLMVQMFHADFKQHLKAIETLSNYINADIEGLVANLDLILKWITLRFFETNPSVLLRSLDYLVRLA